MPMLIAALFACAAHVPSVTPQPTLVGDLERLVRPFEGTAAVAVVDVAPLALSQAGTPAAMPQESVFKLWVALAVHHAHAEGSLAYDERLTIGPEDLRFPYRPIVETVGEDGGELPIVDLVEAMVTVSDNPSTEVLLRRVGGPQRVQAVLDDLAIEGVTVHLGEAGLHEGKAALVQAVEGLDAADAARLVRVALPGRNGATAAGIAFALARLHRGELLPPPETAALLEQLARVSTGSRRLVAGLPPDWTAAHKTGTGFSVAGLTLGTNDVGLLTAPDGRAYAVAVLVAGTDLPMEPREALMAAVVRTVAEHHQP